MSEKASIIYLNTIFDLDEKFRIMFIPDLGDERKKQEVVQTSSSFFEVLSDEIASVYNFFETVRSDSQQRAVSVSEILKKSETSLKDIPGDTNLEKLETIGKKMYQSLFPQQLKKYIAKNPVETLVFLSTNYALPFELMHDGESFLATKYDIYRSPIVDEVPSIKMQEKAEEDPTQISIVTNPTNNLPAAEKETEQIIKFFEAKKDLDINIDVYSKEGASYRALSKIFSSPRLDIFHYCGHSGVKKDDIYFHLADEPYSVTDLYLQYPATFFLNMCESDLKVKQKVDFSGTRTLSFPMAIMNRGAKACLATLWPIVDASAAQFAIDFYKQLLKGVTFGTAVREAKEHLANVSDPNDITWLSFILYGNPGFSTIKIPQKKAPVEEVPISEPEQPAIEPKGVTIFLSYANQDSKTFQVKDLVRHLELLPQIDKVLYRERDFVSNFVGFVNKGIAECDVFIVLCSPNTKQSRNINEEIRAAIAYQKEILPVFLNRDDIPIMARAKMGVQFNPKNIAGSAMQIETRINILKR